MEFTLKKFNAYLENRLSPTCIKKIEQDVDMILSSYRCKSIIDSELSDLEVLTKEFN